VIDDGWTIEATADRFQIDAKTVTKWRDLFLAEGVTGLFNRSSRPKTLPNVRSVTSATTLAIVTDVERSGSPFWLHQLGEYMIAAVLIASSWYSPEPIVQAVLGSLIMINAAVADGAAGAFHLIGRTVHKWIDVAIMVLLLVAALQGWFDVNTTGRIALPLMSASLFMLWLHTDFDDEQ
jgi:hypothetical protein